MNKEHIIQFGVIIDDDVIQERIMKSAEDKIIKNIEKDIRDKLFSFNYYGKRTTELSDYSEKIIGEIINSWKPEIIELAADKLVASVKRSKAFKEAVGEVLND